jgi:hypothetical protein
LQHEEGQQRHGEVQVAKEELELEFAAETPKGVSLTSVQKQQLQQDGHVLAAEERLGNSAAGAEGLLAVAADATDVNGRVAAIGEIEVCLQGGSTTPGEPGTTTTSPPAADGSVQAAAEDSIGKEVGKQQERRSRSASHSPSSALALASPRVSGVTLSSTSCPASRTFWGCLQHELQCENCGHR